jgi:hypothetical protein
MVSEELLGCIVIAATVFMITSADIIRKMHLAFLINIPTETSFAMACGAITLIHCRSALKMKSVFHFLL